MTLLRFSLFSIISVLFVSNTVLASIVPFQVIETDNFKVIESKLNEADKETLILLDIDNTIIMNKSLLFRKNSKHKYLIDEIKRNRDSIPNYEAMINHWRLNRKPMLVNAKWPEAIEKTKANGVKVYSLTQIDAGKSGPIERIEEWRYQDLKKLNVFFSQDFFGKTDYEVFPYKGINQDFGGKSAAVYYKGIFFTGAYTKPELVKHMIQTHRPNKIIFVDDRKDHIINIMNVCKDYNIPYSGIIYRGVDLFEEKPNEAVVKIQKDTLFNKGIWLEDEQAFTLIKQAWPVE